MTTTRRPVKPSDRAFLLDVYSSTREQELTQVPWTDDQKRAFCEMQFAAQDTYYRENFRDTTYEILLVDGEPAGRLYVARWSGEIRIIDISLLPKFRSRGIGRAVIQELQGEAAAAGKPLRIHVEIFNPARRLYDRLGFKQIEDQGVYLFLEWTAPPVSADLPAPPA